MAALKQKIKLFRGLLTGAIAYTGPFYVTIDITCRCNLHCVCCQFHSSLLNIPSDGDKDIPYDLFKKLCNELKAMGTSQIILCGDGEPFLHPHLCDLISVAKVAGFHVMLFTNGTLLDETRLKYLIDLRLDILKVSYVY